MSNAAQQGLRKLSKKQCFEITTQRQFDTSTGTYTEVKSKNAFYAVVMNFSTQQLSGINTLVEDQNRLLTKSKKIVALKNIQIDKKIEFDDIEYQIFFKQEKNGYFVYGVVC